VLAGQLTVDRRILVPRDYLGAATLLGQTEERHGIAGEDTRLLRLTPDGLADLAERHPRLGLRLYRNLAACARAV
jgi:CRP-like cAMP-binding protein